MLIRAFLLVQLLAVPALLNATTIVAVRTPTDIYLGADSRVTEVRPDGRFHYEAKCKIGQVGEIFFAGAGLYGHQPTGLSIRSSLIQAQSSAASLSETVERFETLYTDALERTLRSALKDSPMVYKKYFLDGHVYVYLFAFENGITRYFERIFTIQSSTDPVTVGMERHDCPPGCLGGEATILGIGYADVVKEVSPDVLKTRPPVELITELVDASIKADPAHQSGGPIDILHLNKDGGRWVQKKKECPEIQP